MRFLEAFDYETLVDALAEYTSRYSKLLAEGGKETDIINYRQTIQALIEEINSRRELEKMKQIIEQKKKAG